MQIASTYHWGWITISGLKNAHHAATSWAGALFTRARLRNLMRSAATKPQPAGLHDEKGPPDRTDVQGGQKDPCECDNSYAHEHIEPSACHQPSVYANTAM